PPESSQRRSLFCIEKHRVVERFGEEAGKKRKVIAFFGFVKWKGVCVVTWPTIRSSFFSFFATCFRGTLILGCVALRVRNKALGGFSRKGTCKPRIRCFLVYLSFLVFLLFLQYVSVCLCVLRRRPECEMDYFELIG
ncbi:uncharacterized protein CCOS01_16131, partial [Colletotrichum costaricense]